MYHFFTFILISFSSSSALSLIEALTGGGAFVEKDLITLQIENVKSCAEGLRFGMDMLNNLRRARKVIGTY